MEQKDRIVAIDANVRQAYQSKVMYTSNNVLQAH